MLSYAEALFLAKRSRKLLVTCTGRQHTAEIEHEAGL